MRLRWRFRCYTDHRGTDVVREWYEGEQGKVRAKFLSRLRTLAQLPKDQWDRPRAAELRGNASGLVEIRFEFGNVQYRPLGFFSGESEFTILYVAKEKGWKFVPKSAPAVALKRRAEVEEGRETRALWLALE